MIVNAREHILSIMFECVLLLLSLIAKITSLLVVVLKHADGLAALEGKIEIPLTLHTRRNYL